MGKRREGREAAVQFLFQRDLNGEEQSGSIDDFWVFRPASRRTKDFGTALIRGVVDHQAEIDERIKKYTANYELNRIAAVDRNVLRVAVFEMLHSMEVPPVVAINEAIEVAKAYGSEESGRFVNGILDRIRGDIPRPARAPATPPNDPPATE